ncbi:trypsin-1-like [Leptopilina heterotoma]|uniref:trypsin-1-like n=1 Tax=Leptopilina heterotoma TaxID=63436 RepID=UPI001CA7FCC6|nr:trypsin-1-like [Leptopilina heterotoma]
MNYYFQKTYCILLIFFLSLKYETVLAQNRIIGGSITTIKRFPHMLRLQAGIRGSNLVSTCGASIIGKEWGLTAAHCFDNPKTDYNKISVLAGTTDIKNLARTARRHKVIRVIRNPYYVKSNDKRRIGGDIAVIKVNPPFTYNNVIKPIKLPQRGLALKTNPATISGWGHTKPGGPGSNKLRAVSVPKVDLKKCRKHYLKGNIKLKEGEICYGYNKGANVRDKCQGDSGGPLINADKVELGLVSWGVECGTKGYPGVYTDVLYFRNWIKQQTGI